MNLAIKLRQPLWPLRRRYLGIKGYLRRDRRRAPYSMLSRSPAIFFVKHWMDRESRLQSSLEPLFDALRERHAYFLYSWRWWIENKDHVARWRRLESRHHRLFPKHHFIHLCNTARQWQLFEEAGLDAHFCNQNCLVDERIFRPLSKAEKQFDAVYDARLKRYKRHELAQEIESLALLYAFDPEIDQADEVEKLRVNLRHAHFFNHDEGGSYRMLDSAAINERLNRCRVGLCLSDTEGAMYASIQYLLSGLPVVSTASQGGRDVFFDDSVATIVEPSQRAVRDAVTAWIERDVHPGEIRATTLEKVSEHREHFIALLQSIYDREGTESSARCDWSDMFFDKLFVEGQSHEETLVQLRVQ